MIWPIFILSIIGGLYARAESNCISTNLDALAPHLTDLVEVIDKVNEDRDRCPSDEFIKTKNEFVFAFDGTNSYIPNHAEALKLNSTLDPTGKTIEANLFKELNSNDTWNSLRMEDRRKFLSPLFVTIFGVIETDKNFGILYTPSLISYKEQQEILYYSHNHLKKSLSCLDRIKQINPDAKIKVTGYSWGGDTAQRFINDLDKRNIPIESVFFVDPVRKGALGLGALKNLTGNRNAKFFKRNKNVGKVYNAYQKTDTGSLGLTFIRGNSVQNAEVNLNLSLLGACKGLLKDGGLAVSHINLFKCRDFQYYYREFLSK